MSHFYSVNVIIIDAVDDVNASVARYFAEEYGYVSGVADMKKEIWKRGPIGCGVDATAKFDA